MKAVLVDRVPHDDDRWSYEAKWDGMRAIAFVEGGQVRLQTTNLIDATARFPDFAGLGPALGGHDAVLDGEVVALDPAGRPDFGLLQPLMQARAAPPPDRRAGRPPVRYVLFDLLELDGHDTTVLPYEDRRRLLGQLLPPGEPGATWLVADAQVGGGRALLASMEAAGMEGLIAKRLGSRYEPGGRSGTWLKIKVRREQELVVGGWAPGEGARASSFGALLVGYHDGVGGPLRYGGRVGTGFKEAELRRLLALLAERATADCPFDPPPPAGVARVARWVRPELVVQVAFHEWTADGVLRQASYRGQRHDKDPAEVVLERPAPGR